MLILVRLVFKLKYLFLRQIRLSNYLLHIVERVLLLFLTLLDLLKQALFSLEKVDAFFSDGVDV